MAGENTEIFNRLGRIEQTLARIDERTSRHDTAHVDHETRIRQLEDENAKRKGFVAALVFVSSMLGAAASWVVSHLFHN